MLRAKWIRNAPDGNGTLFRGDIYQTYMEGLLGGTTGHRIWESGTTKNYSLGARFVTGDGRVFKYAKAGATLNTDMGCMSHDTQHVAYATIAHAAAIGDTTIVLDVAGSDGDNGDGAIAADELEGGYLIIFPHSDNSINRMILSNTVVAAEGGEMTLTLDAPLPVALTVDTDHGECMASPYLDVRSTTGGTTSVVGIPCVAATVGQYLWIQTWGPVWIAPQAAVSVGTNNRQVVFRHDGSIDEHDYSDANVAKGQHAGFVIQNAAGGGQGAAFIMLQISI